MSRNITLLLDGQAGQCRLALLENNRLAELDIESFPFNPSSFPYLNQIYCGRVVSATSGGAFINLGAHTGLLAFEPSFAKLHEGQAVLVQVRREPVPDKGSLHKGPLLTRKITLSGRYCVYHPFQKKRVISSKIRDREALAQLKALSPDEAPFTLRQACATATRAQIQGEMQELQQRYNQLVAAAVQAPSQMPWDALSPSQRWLRDLSAADVREILVGHDALYRQCREYLHIHNPSLSPLLRKQAGSTFAAHDLEETWDSLFTDVLPLAPESAGGTIVIENTAAAVVIDINQGSGQTRETNDRAVPLIVQHLKWRRLGGNIIIDFAGLKTAPQDRVRLQNALAGCCKSCSLPLDILGWSRLGWLEARLPKRRVPLRDHISICF